MKKYLLGLLVGFVSLIGFSYGIDYTNGFVEYNGQYFDPSANSGYFCIYIGGDFQSWNLPQGSFNYGFNCTSQGCSSWGQYTYYTYKSCVILDGYEIVNISAGSLPSDGTVYYSFAPLPSECEICQDTGSILSGYILESSVDTLYCVENGYCPVNTGGEIDPGSGNWSALYINGIQHESASLIDINIADYVPWDYSINEDVFDLDIGSGYDQDYINGVIDVQSYRPTSEDFTQTFVGGLILFTPYVVILLFVILVWNLIKKIFKTK